MTPLGPYQITGELGRGAMAVVWRAFDTKLEREVALKEPVFPHGLNPTTARELAARFIREGRIAAQLNHPGLVTIYDADMFDNRPIIAMELIEGETLGDIMTRGRLSVAAAVGITEQLLDALTYAHARGVVHRDIKPDNVFVTDDGRVKLTDFGIAHAGAGTALTQAGTVMGTPGYMAPEQVRGEAVDARADLFSVGVMLYEMLAGANPFIAGDAHPTTIMYRVLNESLPDVRSEAPAVPQAVSVAVAAGTAKEPSDRFGSAAEMRSVLLGMAMPHVVEVPVPARNHSWIPPLLGAGVLALAAILVALLTQTAGTPMAVAPGETTVTAAATDPVAAPAAAPAAVPAAPAPGEVGSELPAGHPGIEDMAGPDELGPTTRAGESPEQYVRRYMQNCDARDYATAFTMLPAETQGYYGDSAGFKSTIEGYGVTGWNVRPQVQQDSDTITVVAAQTAQGMEFPYTWTFEMASGGWICASRTMGAQ